MSLTTGEVVYTDNEDCKCSIDDVFTKSTKAIAQKMALYFNNSAINSTGNVGSKDANVVTKSKTSYKKWAWITGGVVALGVGVSTLYVLLESEGDPQTINTGIKIDVQSE